MSETGTDTCLPVIHVIDDQPDTCTMFERACTRLDMRTRCYSTAEDFLEQYDPRHPGCLVVRLFPRQGLTLVGNNFFRAIYKNKIDSVITN